MKNVIVLKYLYLSLCSEHQNQIWIILYFMKHIDCSEHLKHCSQFKSCQYHLKCKYWASRNSNRILKFIGLSLVVCVCVCRVYFLISWILFVFLNTVSYSCIIYINLYFVLQYGCHTHNLPSASIVCTAISIKLRLYQRCILS